MVAYVVLHVRYLENCNCCNQQVGSTWPTVAMYRMTARPFLHDTAITYFNSIRVGNKQKLPTAASLSQAAAAVRMVEYGV